MRMGVLGMYDPCRQSHPKDSNDGYTINERHPGWQAWVALKWVCALLARIKERGAQPFSRAGGLLTLRPNVWTDYRIQRACVERGERGKNRGLVGFMPNGGRAKKPGKPARQCPRHPDECCYSYHRTGHFGGAGGCPALKGKQSHGVSAGKGIAPRSPR